jgi:DNA polymerase III delta prime subunit
MEVSQYEHLAVSVRPLAGEDNESRIRRIQSDMWISYSRAEAALAAMEDLLTYPKRTRMPNLLIVGPTNNGKTMIVEKFRRDHPSVSASATLNGFASVPVLKVQMPAGPDEAKFFGAVLEELGFPHMLSDRGSKRQDAAMRLLRNTQVSILIIDEVHNLLSGTRLQQRRLLNLLRWLGNELQIPLVAVGTAEALHAIHSDDQLANRFEPLGLPAWRTGREIQQLLKTLEAVLPLRLPSQLSRSSLASKIVSAAEGILGEILSVVRRAAIAAVKSGEEAISDRLIDESGFISPSDRRHVEV